MFAGFRATSLQLDDTTIFARVGGTGPPLLLLHGFPETHLMWRDIATAMAPRFTVVAADLRGYGQSGCPVSSADHSPYAKRAMAGDMVQVMKQLGFKQFMVAGHDRGGRVAYRLALDHPDEISKIAVLDVIPTAAAWDRADARLALAFWPWSLLAQPEPLPERLIGAAPDAIVDNAIVQWGSPAEMFSAQVRDAYVEALRDPVHIHAICEEYRAAATIDREHDVADQANGRRIECPLLALWSSEGGVETWYAREGGPLAIWRKWADSVEGSPVPGGHFFPEEHPHQTGAALSKFFEDNRGNDASNRVL
ncbi:MULTISPECIES: alpha/beta hydrolase [unclassified Mesorhizobium]|uniref:alpha/beta fold hydrolase n=1 Tax=unclassified Mesorhizobium TaxID=325217 RepID=UPI000FD5BC6A|nr:MULTISPECIES: alpha/beta hydrolase [unclassified Mesorhizobium]RUV82919.1 alpha/beta hydrolase [Mesorhizobium sp. M5C.F.Ca.IN.020.14.1.1]RUV28514.1 alpha/beta hydrolase [Mesorhizobium sp. M5C.F.Ca.IN.020.32.2.1]RWE85747.1 MAG: alpha/beta hydrolase [Mesorhizobium sp.]RWG48927.1 MAG: alpha/beta hydrolase [Mesorhizobium sp.]RWH44606.1 MAG: alpha/beta hydrolase [Mesorhizobium sp.]